MLPRSTVILESMHPLDSWNNTFGTSAERYDCQGVERCKPSLERKLFNQMRVIGVNDPNKRMFECRMY